MIRALLLALTMTGSAFASVADDLRKFEGYREHAYVDTTGHFVVGYGHRCERGAKVSRIEAEELLIIDINRARMGAARVFQSYGSQPAHVQDVLVEATFQMGAAGMRKFVKFGEAIQSRDYALASACLIDSKFHKQAAVRCEALTRKLLTP